MFSRLMLRYQRFEKYQVLFFSSAMLSWVFNENFYLFLSLLISFNAYSRTNRYENKGLCYAD